tara:strand:- start:4585 stop:5178 length:594 start_codon:yes stop_codon:yes gene_type:complete
MAIIYTYPKISQIDPSDLLIITDVSDSENKTRSTTVQELGNAIKLQAYPQRYIMNGLVNDLASAGSGGYDYMEWTSNVTGPDQIPAIRTTNKLLLEYVTFVWCGEAALSIGAGEQVEFSIGSFPDGTRTRIQNYTPISNLFTIDSTYNGLFASGQVDVTALNIQIPVNTNIAVVGTETGTVTPNNGELGLSFRFKEI